MKNRIFTLSQVVIHKLQFHIQTYNQLISVGVYSKVRVAHFKREIMYREWILTLANKVNEMTYPDICLTAVG